MSFSKYKKFIEISDTVILYISVSNIYAIEVKPKIINKHGTEIDNVFQTRYGCLKVTDLIGKEFGSRITLPKGWVHVFYPTPELWTITLPHRTQILYTPDISMVVTQLEIGPGSVVCEAGTGSGSLSHALLRAIGPTGKLHTCDFHKERVQVALDEFTRHGHGDRVTVSHRDVCVEGLGVEGVADAVFLDLPKPWEALPHALKAMKTDGGRICSFSPCIEQVCRTCETMSDMGLKEITTLECLAREFQVKYITLPVIPDSKDVEADVNMKAVRSKKIKLDNQSTEKKLDNQSSEKEDGKLSDSTASDGLPDVEKSTGNSVADTSVENSVANTVGNSVADTSVGNSVADTSAMNSVADTSAGNSVTHTSVENSLEDTCTGNSVAETAIGNSVELATVQSNSNPPKRNKEVRFMSGITNLKMPGHTGYLTFATVPPGLRRTAVPTEKPSEDIATD